MASASTYIPISTQTLSTSTASVTFSSIPSTYTDLLVACSVQGGSGSTSGDTRILMQFNGDTGTNYSHSDVYGTGSSSGSQRETNRNQVDAPVDITSAGGGEFSIINYNIMNYSNTTIYKSTLARQGTVVNSSTAYGLAASVSTWRNTSAISSIKFFGAGGNSSTGFAAGSTFTIYGILAA